MKQRKLQLNIEKLRPEAEDYPLPSIAAAILLLLAAPFVSRYLAYIVLGICLYRAVRYDVGVFSTDMVLLSSFSMIFVSPTGSHLISHAMLLGAIWHLCHRRLRVELSFVLLILLVDYGACRVNGEYTNFSYWLTGLMLLRLVALELQPKEYRRMLLIFCAGLVVSSVYALLFRGTAQMQSILGTEALAYMGSSLRRFIGPLGDANFYAAYLILGMAFAFQLWSLNHIHLPTCLFFQIFFGIMGIMTYSKTFIVCAVLLVLAYLYSLISKGKLLMGLVLAGAGLVVGGSSILSTVGYRLASAQSISDLTTGRTDLFILYLTRIVETPISFLFGLGMDAPVLGLATHNVYLDILYYTGALGLALMAVYIVYLTLTAGKKVAGKSKLIRYLSLAMLGLLFCTLQGMFAVNFYILVAAGISSVGLENKGEVKKQCQS